MFEITNVDDDSQSLRLNESENAKILRLKGSREEQLLWLHDLRGAFRTFSYLAKKSVKQSQYSQKEFDKKMQILNQHQQKLDEVSKLMDQLVEVKE
ncbi:MAG: hypothetical protein HRU19_23980 [Pseudobacteriovorax sp.]|nr:hypothetical protein [Pseudobacteriovorax sp.]